MYNKTALDEAGITVKDNMTMDEFIALCKEIRKKTGYKTNIAYNNGENFIEYFLRANDVVMFEDENWAEQQRIMYPISSSMRMA